MPPRTQLASRLPFDPPAPTELAELIAPSPYLPTNIVKANLESFRELLVSREGIARARRETRVANLIAKAVKVLEAGIDAFNAQRMTEALKPNYYAPYSLLFHPFKLLSEYTIAYANAGFTKP